MLKSIALLFSIIILIGACAPGPQNIHPGGRAVLTLQVIDVIGPLVDGTRPLSSPRGVAVNQVKDIFIADYGNDRVVKLDSTHAFIDEVGGFGSGDYSLSGPLKIALDNVSNFYVVDSGNHRIVRFDRLMNFVSSSDGYWNDQEVNFIRPLSVDVNDRGELFVGDEGLGACYKLDQFFNYIFEFGGRDDIQSVYSPVDINCVDNRQIYVADHDHGLVFVFDDYGMYRRSIGEKILKQPTGVAVSSQGGIWVTDEGTGFLYCFDLNGREIFRWNGEGSNQLYRPSGLTIDDDGYLYIVDSQTSRIFVIRPIAGD